MKASCEFAEYWISAKIDGAPLADEIAGQLEAHLEVCAPCRQLLDSERERARTLSAALSADDRHGSLAALKGQIVEEARSGGKVIPLRGVGLSRRWRGPLAMTAAALLFVTLGGLFLFRGLAVPDSQPWQLTIEQLQWDVEPVPDIDGRRLKRETRRVRDLRFDEKRDPGLILDREHVDTRYIRFTDYR